MVEKFQETLEHLGPEVSPVKNLELPVSIVYKPADYIID